jgi:hypothetical protein
MRRNGYTPAVVMFKPLMRSRLTSEIESVADESCDQISGGQRTEATIIDGHVLHGNRNAGCLLGYLVYLNRVVRTLG